MKQEYIITNDDLSKKGLDLNDYAVEGTKVEPIIYNALDLAITRVLKLNDDFHSEEDIEKTLDDNADLVKPFKKLQYRVIYNLIFLGDNDPIDKSVDDIICFDLHWGKINGFQKSIFGNRG